MTVDTALSILVLYIQDDWKVKPTFTLNAGLRYDEMANFFSILSPKLTNFTFGKAATYNEQIASGVTGLAPSSHVLAHNIWGLTPRVGFAWDVFGNGRTALRGGAPACFQINRRTSTSQI